MSPYYKYQFVSVEPIISLIKEEFKSYIDTGAIDDAIWSIYVDNCLKKLGKGMLQLNSIALNICNYEARLPDNFISVREAWLCTNVTSSYILPGANYEEVKIASTSTLLTNHHSYCEPCGSCNIPDVIKAVYKTTHEAFAYYKQQYLLRPGNINTKGYCASDCMNFNSDASDTFDIVGNKIRTNFPDGDIYLLYYSKEFDETGYQLIPDNFRIQEYIELYIKAKVYEQLSNQVTDETYNQIEKKAEKYEVRADEAYIMADIEGKKETVYDKHRKALRTKNRFNIYQIR